jgi:hypothetical protein
MDPLVLGSHQPYTTSNGENFVALCTLQLYVNSTIGKQVSQIFKFLCIATRNKEDKVRFTTSICPLVYRWHVILKSNFVPSFLQRVFQKWLKNFVSWSETMLLRTPCKRTIFLKNKSAICTTSSVLLQGMKWDILENRSTTTITESLPHYVLGNPSTKSILMSI